MATSSEDEGMLDEWVEVSSPKSVKGKPWDIDSRPLKRDIKSPKTDTSSIEAEVCTLTRENNPHQPKTPPPNEIIPHGCLNDSVAPKFMFLDSPQVSPSESETDLPPSPPVYFPRERKPSPFVSQQQPTFVATLKECVVVLCCPLSLESLGLMMSGLGTVYFVVSLAHGGMVFGSLTLLSLLE